jgi:hypothetical protein
VTPFVAGQSNSMDSYILRGGAAATERLRLLSEAKWPTTNRLLSRVTDQEIDKIVADLEDHARSPRTQMSMARIFQIWGSKPL